MIDFFKEFWEFLNERKKYWLLPIIIVLALFGVLIVLSQGSAVAPFIYTIFLVHNFHIMKPVFTHTKKSSKVAISSAFQPIGFKIKFSGSINVLSNCKS